MMHSKSELKVLVEQVQKLPTPADIAMRILELASDQNVSLKEISHAINQDPSLAGRILKIANSPFYGMTRQVDSLQLALVILGLNEVRNIALGLSLFDTLKRMDSHITYDRRQFWFHSASCGVVSRILGRKCNFRNEGTDFLAGLLHDMGKIIIDEYLNSEFFLIFGKTLSTRMPMREAEREYLGESHEQIGGWLVDKWRLPENLQDAIEHHHTFFSTATPHEVKDPRLVALTYLAEAFCGHFSIGWDGDSVCGNVKEPAAWDILLSSSCGTRDVDQILIETLQAYNEVQNHILVM